jgi:guanylate kinase
MPSEHLNLHLIPGISASGKTTAARFITQQLTAEGYPSANVVPHTTRAPRPHEEDGVDYYFHTPSTFRREHLNSKPRDGVTWRYSYIGENYYFNNDEATLPNLETTVKVLPVALSAVTDILDDYSNHEALTITVVPIVIAPHVQGRWLQTIWMERPERDLRYELDAQEDALQAIAHLITDTFTPTWHSKQGDLERHYQKIRPLIIPTAPDIERT